MAQNDRKESTSRAIFDRAVYEPRVALRRVQGAILALVIIATVGVLGYMVFKGFGFTKVLYMTVITLTTVGYREVHKPCTLSRGPSPSAVIKWGS